MGKSAPSPPPAPDPAATAAAQAAANKESAIASANINMVNQYTPYGDLEYSERGTASDGTPQYSATQTLDPSQQAQLDLTNQAAIKYGETANEQLSAVSDRLASPLSYESLGAAPVVNEQTRQATADAISQRLQPYQDRDRSALETRLANQGIGYGTDAYNAAFDTFNRGVNDQRLAVDAAAGDEMARMFGLESTARDRGINELIQQRQVPLNELSAMLSGSQVQGPSFVNTPQQNIGAADIMGATYGSYNGQMNAANAAGAQQSADNQGLSNLLGTVAMGAMMFSDRRLKRDVQKVGAHKSGLPIYAFRYHGSNEEHVGFMADEVAEKFPDAVYRVGDYDMVDYGAIA